MWGTTPGTLPQALYFCAYSARCLCDDCITLQGRSYKAKENTYFTESNLHAEKYKKQEGKRIKIFENEVAEAITKLNINLIDGGNAKSN